MKKIKKYQITFNPEDEQEGIELISFVKDPAIMVKGMCFSDQEKLFQFKASKDKMIVVAPAMIPDIEIYRRDEEGEYYVIFSKEVVFELMKKFNSKMQEFRFNYDHDANVAPAFILESWVKEDDTFDKSIFYGFEDVPIGTWFISAQITDKEFWENQVKKQGKFSLSIEGWLKMQEMQLNKQLSLYTSNEDIKLSPLQKYRIKKKQGFVEPNAGESEEEYIGRCMGSDEMNSEFPDESQRFAVCKAKWDKA